MSAKRSSAFDHPVRRCCRCKRELPLDNFRTVTNRQKQGSRIYVYVTPSSECLECNREYKRERRRLKAEQAGRVFVARADRAAYEAHVQTAREQRKAERQVRYQAWIEARSQESALREAAIASLPKAKKRPKRMTNGRPKFVEIPTLRSDEMERFQSRYDTVGDCWEWAGRRSRDGYGSFTVYRGGEQRLIASRVAWAIANGPIPDGLLVLHTCDNPPCVNPAHLFVGTDKANIHDMVQKGRHHNQRKDACLQCGSHLIEATAPSQKTTVTGKGRRRCAACKKAWQADYMRRRQAKIKEAMGALVPTHLGSSGTTAPGRVLRPREVTRICPVDV